ncbi:hypothetical protein ABH935_004920 [Catenulispora sp. GAS73]|uniref:hypothetical protein n=1 Tax=Catenulispora sp. GAS73 TaxID=3156269 RepID=UPI0035198BE9
MAGVGACAAVGVRVTEHSTHVAFILETLQATHDADRLNTAADQLRALLAPNADHVTVQYLSPAKPQAGT